MKFGIGQSYFLQAKRVWLAEQGMTEAQAFLLTSEECEILVRTGTSPEVFLQEKQRLIAEKIAEKAANLELASCGSGLTKKEEQIVKMTGLSPEVYQQAKKGR
ncbi:hypothetical protein [Vibrio quintilis]|nr:hypothetical protein [Vibrio quintilis]